MLLIEIEIFISQYEKGAKKISLRSTRPTIIKENFHLKLEPAHGNYDLFFNKNGVLLHSVHTERNKSYKIIYGYNKEGAIHTAMQLISEKNELVEISEFIYDENGRIETELCRAFSSSFGETLKERIHSYSENTEEIFMTSDDKDEDEHTLYLTFDKNKRKIEEKAVRNNEELVWWNKSEYNEKGELIKEISLNEKGEQDGLYEFFPNPNGIESGYRYSSRDSNYLREYAFEFNEKNIWISQVMINDGEPKYCYNRVIEYY